MSGVKRVNDEHDGGEEKRAKVGGVEVIAYSEKAIAIFGDTKPIKDKLKEFGARFNQALAYNGGRSPGWIIQKSAKDGLMKMLDSMGVSVSGTDQIAPATEKEGSHDTSGSKTQAPTECAVASLVTPAAPIVNNSGEHKAWIQVVSYSEKSLAIFGDTKPIKDKLKEIGARFNQALSRDGGRSPGWIVQKSQKELLLKTLESLGVSVTVSEPSHPAGAVTNTDSNASLAKTEAPTIAARESAESSASSSGKEKQEGGHNNSIQVVSYSEKSLAIFGDTKPVKDKLKEIGARFNQALSRDGGRSPGWIIQKSQTELLLKTLESLGVSLTLSEPSHPAGAVTNTNSNTSLAKTEASTIAARESAESSASSSGKEKQEGGHNNSIQVVSYSEKSLAIFGDTKLVKDKLKEIGARFNNALSRDGGRSPGWIIPKSAKDKLLNTLQSSGVAVTSAAELRF